MKDTCKPFRNAIHAVINGLITYRGDAVPIYDEKVFTGQMPAIYILYGTQSESDIIESECTWTTTSKIDIWIVCKTGSEVSKNVIDDIADQLYTLLLPGPTVDAFLQPQGLTIMYLRREASVEGQFNISPTQSELRKVITLTANIVENIN